MYNFNIIIIYVYYSLYENVNEYNIGPSRDFARYCFYLSFYRHYNNIIINNINNMRIIRQKLRTCPNVYVYYTIYTPAIIGQSGPFGLLFFNNNIIMILRIIRLCASEFTPKKNCHGLVNKTVEI